MSAATGAKPEAKTLVMENVRTPALALILKSYQHY